MKAYGIVLISMMSVVGCAGTDGAGGTDALAVAGADELGSGSRALGCATLNDGNTTLRFINKCSGTVYFQGSLIGSGSLTSGQEACRTLGSVTQEMSSLRYWGYLGGQNPGAERYSLAELTLNTRFYSWNSYDWFNLSHVDAHNLPMKIIPYGSSGDTTCTGLTRSCPRNLLPDCPPEGQYRDASGRVISCVNPERDNPNNPVARYFDAACSQAYSWSGDSAGSMASCNAEDFDIVFCPAL